MDALSIWCSVNWETVQGNSEQAQHSWLFRSETKRKTCAKKKKINKPWLKRSKSRQMLRSLAALFVWWSLDLTREVQKLVTWRLYHIKWWGLLFLWFMCTRISGLWSMFSHIRIVYFSVYYYCYYSTQCGLRSSDFSGSKLVCRIHTGLLQLFAALI
jgi:hypothetical protein